LLIGFGLRLALLGFKNSVFTESAVLEESRKAQLEGFLALVVQCLDNKEN